MYKAFEDHYKEQPIRHLLLAEHNGALISPPFATELCKDYSKVAVINDRTVEYIDLDLGDATSKFNAVAKVGESSWLIPYAIWDDFNVVVQLENFTPKYHYLNKKGKGQFYSVAFNNNSACSFPLGYEDTNFLIYIKDNKLETIDTDTKEKKAHMGTVYCNGSFYSMPRGESTDYNYILEFDGTEIKKHTVDVESVARKYTDAIVVGNKLYSLPYGETAGLKTVLVFDTETKKASYYDIDIPDFAKKYNVQVLVDDTIIGLPYGDEDKFDSNWGVTFNVNTLETSKFDIGINYGGKYRYRCGVAYKDRAVFFPTGTPGAPILSVGKDGSILRVGTDGMKIFGRPILHNDLIYCVVFDTRNHKHSVVTIDAWLRVLEIAEI